MATSPIPRWATTGFVGSRIDFDAMFKRRHGADGRKSYDAAKQSGYGMRSADHMCSRDAQQADAPDVTVSNGSSENGHGAQEAEGERHLAVGGGELSGACSSWAWSISWRSQSFRCCWGRAAATAEGGTRAKLS